MEISNVGNSSAASRQAKPTECHRVFPWQNSPSERRNKNLNQGARAAFRPIHIPPDQIPELSFHHLSLPPLTAEAKANVVL